MPDAVIARGLGVAYDGVAALDGLDLRLPAGASLAVIGPNGSGKSTLLKAIAGVIRPTRGRIELPLGPPAFVLQSTDVDRSVPVSVREAVSMARYPSVGLLRRFRAADREAVDAALERLAVADLADRQLHHLSGGQRQRVFVAQGLAQESPLLLLDEPLTGLDVTSRSVILRIIDEEHAAGRTVVATTHDLDDARRCDLVLLLDTTPIALGPPAEVLEETHLREAFGGRFVRLGESFMLDDPHHSH